MRSFTTILGMIIGIGSCLFVIASTKINPAVFLDLRGLSIVVLGTLAAILLSYSITQIKRIMWICSQVFLRNEHSFHNSAKDLIQFCKAVSESGVANADPSKVHPFIRDCLILVKDGYSNTAMQHILSQRISSYSEQEGYDIMLLRSMAKYPPAFGMLGTVIGLIALMAEIGGGLEVDQVGLYMAIALTTTMYGVAIANLIFKPLADNLEMRSFRNTKVRQMIMEAALLLNSKSSLVVIQDTVNSFLSPSEAVNIFSGGDQDAA